MICNKREFSEACIEQSEVSEFRSCRKNVEGFFRKHIEIVFFSCSLLNATLNKPFLNSHAGLFIEEVQQRFALVIRQFFYGWSRTVPDGAMNASFSGVNAMGDILLGNFSTDAEPDK